MKWDDDTRRPGIGRCRSCKRAVDQRCQLEHHALTNRQPVEPQDRCSLRPINLQWDEQRRSELIADGSRDPRRYRSTLHCSSLIDYRWTLPSVCPWLRQSCISWVAVGALADSSRHDRLLAAVTVLTLTADCQRHQGSWRYRRSWLQMTALSRLERITRLSQCGVRSYWSALIWVLLNVFVNAPYVDVWRSNRGLYPNWAKQFTLRIAPLESDRRG